MTNNTDNTNAAAEAAEKVTWQLNALTEALGDLTLTVSDSLSVGRGSDNDVVLGSKQVSRNHAVLSVLDGQLYVKDLASSNGTFINEQRLEGSTSTPLQADDTIGFASFSFQVSAPTSAATPMTENLPSAPVMTEDTPATTSTDNGVMAEEPVVKETGIEDMLPATAVSVDAVPVESASEPLVEPANEPTADTNTGNTNTSNQAVVEEVVAQELVIEESTIDESAIHEQAVNESVIKQTGIEELLPSTDNVEPVTTDSVVGSAPVTTTIMADEVVNQESVTQELVTEEPVVKETGIDEVLSATDTVESTPVAATSAASVQDEPLVEQPVVHEEPVVREEPATKPEHDKTTKTALQEEADPDVLRAKQAATAQFSGTANLGQPRDLGTEGNNAMDQAINNPANAGHIEKKPSGGWFIWVFIAILIIGLALWLFNMGGV